ncbi:MAG TPA: DUF1552 domain-containing protein [Polyangia bacterium]|nr:DUF1552 domain-containing protein [Polyangia bacterium]
MSKSIKTSSSNPHYTRRRFLRDIGIGAAALPFLGGLESLYEKAEAATAAAAVPKKRFLFMYSPNGAIYYNWRMRVPGQEHTLDIDISDGVTGFTPTNFLLKPLAPNAKKLLVVDRLSWISARQTYQTSTTAPDHITHTGGHQKGMGSLLTGGVLIGGDGSFGNDGLADGVSVDQVLAAQLFSKSPIPSLEIGVQVDENLKDRYVDKRVSYNAPVGNVPQPRTPQNDPFQLFARVFGNTTGNAGSGASSMRAFLDKSVLDATVADFTRVQAKLSSSDRILLQQHSDSIRKLETQLMAPAVSCAMETPPSGGGFTPASDPAATKKWAMTPANFPTVGAMQMEIAVQAMACGITNIVTFMWANSENDLQYPWLPIPYGNGAGMTTSGHHGMSHARDPNLVTIDQWYAKQFGSMITALDAIPDSGQTGSVLDNSLMMWSSCLGDASSHFSDNVPIVLAGSNGGYFKQGRLIRMNDTYTAAQWTGDPLGPESTYNNFIAAEDKARQGDQKTIGSPDLSNNDLLVTILESFGLDPATNADAFKPFQDARFYKGPLTNLKKT